MLIVTFLSFLLMMAWATTGLATMPNLTMSAFYGNPDLEYNLLVSAQGGCVPNISVEVSSPFYRSASMDALRRLREAEVRGTILKSIEQFSRFLHISWDGIAAKYDQFAEHMRSSLNRTWDNHLELRPKLTQVDPLSKALINRGNQIENCLKQVEPNTTWMVAPCLHDLLRALRNDDKLWYAPNGKQLDWRVSLPFYEQWAADHAVLSVFELRTLGAVYSVMCDVGMKETEACTSAREDFRESMQGFESFLSNQLAFLFNTTSGLYPLPEGWGRDPASLSSDPKSTSSMPCMHVEYANVKGRACDETGLSSASINQIRCTHPINDNGHYCSLVIQHNIPFFDLATQVCAWGLSRLFAYHQNPFQHAVAAAYSTSLGPFYTLQKRLLSTMYKWYQREFAKELPADESNPTVLLLDEGPMIGTVDEGEAAADDGVDSGNGASAEAIDADRFAYM